MPCLEACLLITTLVEQVVLVHVVDVDELSSLDHVTNYPSVQGESHLGLLKQTHVVRFRTIVIISHLCTSVS